MARTVKPAAASKASASPAKSRAKPTKSAKPAATPPSSKAPAKKATSAAAGGHKSKPKPVSTEQRRHYIEVAAYYRAERRGFDGADPAEDWMQAEIEVDRLLAEGKLNS